MPEQAKKEKRVTAADVARSLGLSRATVGFVLNNTPGQTISGPTRTRVLAEADRLGYRPHRAARMLVEGRSRIVLLVLPDWPIDYSMRVHLDEASHVLDEAGYSLVTTTPHPGDRALPLWETLDPDVVLGLTPFTQEQLDALQRSGVKRIFPAVAAEQLAREHVALGYASGPRRQIEHLHDRGRHRIAYAGSTDRRLADLVAERRALARDTAMQLTGEALAGDIDIDETTAAQVLASWLNAGVDGIAAYNDDVAALLVGAALRSGVPVPERIAVIGHDDSPLARLFVPSLSSVRMDSAGLGRYLAQVALAQMGEAPAPANVPESASVVIARETT